MGTIKGWRPLDVAVIGGGIGGFSTAIALRRAGHQVTIYERADFAGESGAAVSCAANGTKWLLEWDVDVAKGDPVVLKQLISRDWKTGEATNVYDLSDYEQKWGYVYNLFHRQYMHAMLMDCATSPTGQGLPVKLLVNHKCTDLDVEEGAVAFEYGRKANHDLVVGADGIGSYVRTALGIHTEKNASTSSCLHANVDTATAVKLGLIDYSTDSAIQYWGGHDIYKIVQSPCNGGKQLSYYCFFPREKGDFIAQNWTSKATLQELLAPYPDLDPQVLNHLKLGTDISPWRLWIHEPYKIWQKGVVCLMGDAAHPMMPDQSQGACAAIEDAAALGLVFNKANFTGDIRLALDVYEKVRKPRATRIQAASARARENIHERIGFSSNTNNPLYKVQNESEKLTMEELNLYDMHKHVEDTYRQQTNAET